MYMRNSIRLLPPSHWKDRSYDDQDMEKAKGGRGLNQDSGLDSVALCAFEMNSASLCMVEREGTDSAVHCITLEAIPRRESVLVIESVEK